MGKISRSLKEEGTTDLPWEGGRDDWLAEERNNCQTKSKDRPIFPKRRRRLDLPNVLPKKKGGTND
jgi:hypothetical protein